ncbi:Metal ABC transporter substrate-binding lipoprotein precursor [Mycobacterium basiliense]|uniref:Metal ABC transporter substrate-binding lipoprotein n=1 Tax=Mycobacterium basiliense TaxID=2094119 RepID=A0A447GK47_9MYCO|nr:zinc ABC transporter substrate-binding protein [Mycobacterium basiliense]VDM90851.1 Metal ABC transporter substrate-binding lipoprotein precursor [Mycobacterium basiliense]
MAPAVVVMAHRLSAILFCAIASSAPVACGVAGPAHPGAGAIVASTDVWGSVASAVAGGHVTVKSIVAGAAADPHSYQPTPADAAEIADAALVIYNGGGYDPWVDRLLANHPAIDAVNAYSFLGAADNGYQPDEHVFYNLSVAKAVAATIAERLALIDPTNASSYRANAAEFGRDADTIANSEHAIAIAYPATGVLATEPVVHYLLAASGLIDRTPAAFATASENDDDPAPADMASVLDLINHREVSALLVNPQTTTAATADLQAAARRAGVPVTEVSETLPSGTDYLTWQRDTVNQLRAALRSTR